MSSSVTPDPAAKVADAEPLSLQNPNKVERSKKIDALHGLRGLAAYGVVLYHVFAMLRNRNLVPRAPDTWAGRMLENAGGYFVSLFFCISGFLIVQSLIRHANVKEFAGNRVKRIYPAFIVLHLLMFTIGVAADYRWMGPLKHDPVSYAANFVSNALFLPGVFNVPLAQLNAWSLSYEALFYILAAIGYLSFQNRRSNRPKSWLQVATFVVGSIAFLIWRPRAMFFLVGIACFFLNRNSKEPAAWEKVPWLGILLVPATIAVYGFRDYVALPLFAALFWLVVRNRGWVATVLSSRPLQFLGTISYSMYLVHPFIMDPMRTIVIRLEPNVGRIPAIVIFAICAVGIVPPLARLYYELTEVRLTNWLFKRRNRVVG